jgi:hypothetical protein
MHDLSRLVDLQLVAGFEQDYALVQDNLQGHIPLVHLVIELSTNRRPYDVLLPQHLLSSTGFLMLDSLEYNQIEHERIPRLTDRLVVRLIFEIEPTPLHELVFP